MRRSSFTTFAAVDFVNIDAGANSTQGVSVGHAAAAEPARGTGGSKPMLQVIQVEDSLRNSKTREYGDAPFGLAILTPKV